MVRRKRIDIFFILYLTAIIGFVVVSKKRDQIDEHMRQHSERIISTFIPRVPMYLESDTVRWYVSADSSGIVTGNNGLFRDKLFVRDIRADDVVSISLHSVIHESLLTRSDIITLGGRTAYGPLENETVYFPISALFARTGRYSLNISASANRVKEIGPGRFSYHGIEFDSVDVSREMIESLEQSSITLCVEVIDTSVTRVKTLEALKMEIERSEIYSAIGFEESNTISVNLGWSEPDVSIVQGFGILEKTSGTERQLMYRWLGTVRSSPDTVIIEARLSRGAGGKDIVRSMFPVTGVTPVLRTPIPQSLFAGEDLNLDIRVAGLDEEGLYTWELFESASAGDLISKSSGRGSMIHFRIPNSYGGKRLVVEARYRGLPYNFLSVRTHASGHSRFSIPVLNPPTQIQLPLPSRASVTESFKFSASRYSDHRFRGEQPIEKLSDVQVELFDEENNVIRTDVSMIRKGEFVFIIQDKALIRPEGERVIVRITIEGDSFQGTMYLFR